MVQVEPFDSTIFFAVTLLIELGAYFSCAKQISISSGVFALWIKTHDFEHKDSQCHTYTPYRGAPLPLCVCVSTSSLLYPIITVPCSIEYK